jgi:V/A-type H+-transporting ATPase subunit C
MQISASNSYLNTRVSTMTARLQPTSWFQKIASTAAPKTDDILKQLSLLDDSPSSGGLEPETLMLHTFLSEFRILLRPMEGQARRLLLQWIRRVELRNLKSILHGALLHKPLDELRSSMLRIGDLETLPFKDLLQADDILEMLRILDKTGYAAMARQARHLFEQHNDPFFVNASIDQRYFNDLVISVSWLPDRDKVWLKNLFGPIIDRHNLIWLMRYRFTYGLKSAETWYLLSPGGRYLPSSTLYRLVNLDSPERVLDQLPTALKRVIDDRKNLFDIELTLENALEQQTWKILKQQESMITRALAWLILREKQLLRVRGILKGKQLSLDSSLVSYAMGLEH